MKPDFNSKSHHVIRGSLSYQKEDLASNSHMADMLEEKARLSTLFVHEHNVWQGSLFMKELMANT